MRTGFRRSANAWATLRGDSMAVLAQPQKAGEIADVRIALVEIAGLVPAYKLLDGEAGTALDLTL